MLSLFTLTEHAAHVICIQYLPLDGFICELGAVTSEVENGGMRRSNSVKQNVTAQMKYAINNFHIFSAHWLSFHPNIEKIMTNSLEKIEFFSKALRK